VVGRARPARRTARLLVGRKSRRARVALGPGVRLLDRAAVDLGHGSSGLRDTLLWTVSAGPGEVHRLAVKDVAVAVVLWDGDGEAPAAEVAFWACALDEASGGRPPRKLLVRCRRERGRAPASKGQIGDLIERFQFAGQLEVCLGTGEGIAALAEQIAASLCWDEQGARPPLPTLRAVRDVVRDGRRRGRTHTTVAQVLARVRECLAGEEADDEGVTACLGRLEVAGHVQILSSGRILLQPDRVRQYGEALWRAAEAAPDGLRCIPERQARAGLFVPERRLEMSDPTLLAAAVEELVARAVARREATEDGSVLVFPGPVDRPMYRGPTVPAAAFRFDGAVGAVFSFRGEKVRTMVRTRRRPPTTPQRRRRLKPRSENGFRGQGSGTGGPTREPSQGSRKKQSTPRW
jgi:hypothetical protein